MVDPDVNGVFAAALGLTAPWQVMSVAFDEALGELEIALDFPRGSVFPCGVDGCGATGCRVHDTTEKRWRHLDFFQHQAYLRARVPRVSCPEHGVHLVAVSWARPGSGFTMLMEAAMLTFAAQMPIAPLARMAREHDTRIWRVIEHHVGAARSTLDLSSVTKVGIDETSARRGQDYVSIFMDLDDPRVVFATPGRDAETVKAFAEDLKAHKGNPETQVAEVCCDMSGAFISGVAEYLSEHPAEEIESEGSAEVPVVSADAQSEEEEPVLHTPEIVFDRFHVVMKLNEAIDEVRRQEVKSRPELKRTRYTWLKNEENLTDKQRTDLLWLTRPSMNLKTARAARWRDDFNAFYEQETHEDAEFYLKRWCDRANRSRLEPVRAFVRTVKAHFDGILAWQDKKITNDRASYCASC